MTEVCNCMSYKCFYGDDTSCTWFSYGCDWVLDCTSSGFTAFLLRIAAPIGIAFYAFGFIIAALILIACGNKCFEK